MARPRLVTEINFSKGALDYEGAASNWVNVSLYVREVSSIRRGRQNELDRLQAGTMSIILDNRDGRFDPTNLSSPYAPNVQLMRQIRVRAYDFPFDYLFQGYIESWGLQGDASDGVCVVGATDAITILNNSVFESNQVLWSGSFTSASAFTLNVNTDFRALRGMSNFKFSITGPAGYPAISIDFSYIIPPSTTRTNITASPGIGNPTVATIQATDVTQFVVRPSSSASSPVTLTIETVAPTLGGGSNTTSDTDIRMLRAITWPDQYVDIQNNTGTWVPVQQFSASGSILALLQRLLDTEGGYAYVAKNGMITVRNRAYATDYRAPIAAFGPGNLPYQKVNVAYDERCIINDVTVQRTGGQPITLIDTTSRAKYGARANSQTDLLYVDDSTARTAAQVRLSRYKEPGLRITSIELDGEAHPGLWPVLLGAELGGRYLVGAQMPYGTAWQMSTLESIEWRITPRSYRVIWGLSPAPSSPIWQLDDSTRSILGSTTFLG